ncbi:unnamed protein product [Arctogadus glacialis]
MLVSYLILHKFQRRQAKLAQVVAELQEQEGRGRRLAREKAQRESLELGEARAKQAGAPPAWSSDGKWMRPRS